jgi:hypothetical protein
MTVSGFFAVSSETNSAEVKDWVSYADLFPGEQLAAAVARVPHVNVPEPYRRLLVHDQHMTGIVERFYKSSVDVRVLARRIDGSVYSRKIILTTQDTGAVVQFAFMQLQLDAVSDTVRSQILSEQVPLGRVLVDHGLQCDIELISVLKVTIGEALSRLLNVPAGIETYGRIAQILSGDKSICAVIEVLTPINP